MEPDDFLVGGDFGQLDVVAVGAMAGDDGNLVAPRIGGPWIAPEYRFRLFADLSADRWDVGVPPPDSSAHVIVTVSGTAATINRPWNTRRFAWVSGCRSIFRNPRVNKEKFHALKKDGRGVVILPRPLLFNPSPVSRKIHPRCRRTSEPGCRSAGASLQKDRREAFHFAA